LKEIVSIYDGNSQPKLVNDLKLLHCSAYVDLLSVLCSESIIKSVLDVHQ